MQSNGAVISDCNQYRYKLWRIWDVTIPQLTIILYNPSTADATKDDPTLRRCIQYAKNWGYGGITLLNLFALRSYDPKEVKTHPSPEGPLNLEYIQEALLQRHDILCAWGLQGGTIPPNVSKSASKIFILGSNKDGSPKHPLYLPKSLQLVQVVRTE